MIAEDPYDSFKTLWAHKTTAQVRREMESMHKYMERNARSYPWHGGNNIPPGGLGDGDKLLALRAIITERSAA